MNERVVASAIAGVSAASTVRHSIPVMQLAIAAEVARAHHDARTTARATLSAELNIDVAHATDVADIDGVAATSAAAGLAAAWGAAALLALAANGEKGPQRALARLPADLELRARRTAATEVARTFNDERDEILVVLGGGDHGDARPLRQAPLPGLFKVWSAVLDGVTCQRCWNIDGTTLEAHKPFAPGPPPLHPNCRCIIEHVIVPRPDRLEDIKIDYDLFKRELADVIREERAAGRREALEFVSESLGSKRSPLTLTKRFRDEPYATRR